eukprot:jgi/Chlat1/7480/Chrsp60S06995
MAHRRGGGAGFSVNAQAAVAPRGSATVTMTQQRLRSQDGSRSTASTRGEYALTLVLVSAQERLRTAQQELNQVNGEVAGGNRRSVTVQNAQLRLRTMMARARSEVESLLETAERMLPRRENFRSDADFAAANAACVQMVEQLLVAWDTLLSDMVRLTEVTVSVLHRMYAAIQATPYTVDRHGHQHFYFDSLPYLREIQGAMRTRAQSWFGAFPEA